MIHVYILNSLKNNNIYVGMSNGLDRRLIEHNNGKSKYTKAYIPWEIVYSEEFPNYTEARKREKYFKSTAGKNWLRKNNHIR